MSPRINRNDPAYETAMREAKVLFDQAMAKSAMKGRGRPAAQPAAVPVPLAALAPPTTEELAAVAAEIASELGGDAPVDLIAEIADIAEIDGGASAEPADDVVEAVESVDVVPAAVPDAADAPRSAKRGAKQSGPRASKTATKGSAKRAAGPRSTREEG